MELNEQKFTERQVEIINQIGSEYRNNIAKDQKRFVIFFSLLQMLFVALAVGYYLFSKSYIFSIILLAIVIYDVLIVFKRKNNFYNDLKNADDYKIGCYAINKDKRIVGYADKKVANYKKLSKYIGIAGIVIGAMMFYNVYQTKSVDASSLKTLTGTITNIEAKESYTYSEKSYNIKYYNLTIQIPSAEDQTVNETAKGNYIIYGCYSQVGTQFDTIKANISSSTTNEITIKYVDTYFESYGFYDIYDLTINNTNYVSVDTINDSISKTKTTYTTIAIIALALGVIVISSGYAYNAIFYKKMKENESIDINYTEEEKNEINEDLEVKKAQRELEHQERVSNISSEKIEELKSVSIKTKAASSAYMFKGVISLAGVIALVYAIFYGNESNKTLLIGVGAIAIFFGLVGIIDTFTSYELLEGNTLTVKKFFKTSIVDVSDVSSINFQGNYYILTDADNNQIAYLSNNKYYVREIIENLEGRGVLVNYGAYSQTSDTTSNLENNTEEVKEETLVVEERKEETSTEEENKTEE